MHGGVKFYRGAARAARAYVERDRSRADDYYLGEGTGVAERLTATPDGRRAAGSMDGDTYEQWVAGIDVDTGSKKGRLLKDEQRAAVRRGHRQRTQDLVARSRSAPRDLGGVGCCPGQGGQRDRRLGRGARDHSCRAARTSGAGAGREDRGSGHPALHVPRRRPAPPSPPADQRPRLRRRRLAWHPLGRLPGLDRGHQRHRPRSSRDRPGFRAALAARGFTLDPETSEVSELAPYVGAFSARTAQIRRNVDRYEAEWRGEHPGEEPGPRLREAWDRRAWAEARPDKVVPRDGRELVERWNHELRDLGYRDPAGGGRCCGARSPDGSIAMPLQT